jgi:hypothetical protein
MNKKVFGIFNIIDLIIVAVIIIALLGVGIMKTKSRISHTEATKETKKVEIDVIIQGGKVSSDKNLFNAGQKTFITIRNVPYTELEIVKSLTTVKKTAIPDPKNPEKAIAVDDPSMLNTYDFLVTVADKAVITPDGAVVGGNKIKIGLPIILEGVNYRLPGVVSDVRGLE